MGVRIVHQNGIRKARKAAGMTQQKLADLLGVNRATVSKYESGAIDPPYSQMQNMSDVLGVSLHKLLAIDDDVFLGIREEDGETVFEIGGSPQLRIAFALEKLNDSGQQIAAARVEELTEIPKYQKTPPPDETDGG